MNIVITALLPTRSGTEAALLQTCPYIAKAGGNLTCAIFSLSMTLTAKRKYP